MTRSVQIWIAVLAGPAVWFVSLLANFAITLHPCAAGWKGPLFTVVVVALLITAWAGWFAWHLWRAAGVELPGESGGAVGYRRTMGLAGVLLNAMFLVVIIAQSVPNMVFGGCE